MLVEVRLLRFRGRRIAWREVENGRVYRGDLRTVGGLDTHRAIHREAAVVRPGTHFCGVILVDQAASEEAAQDTVSHTSLHVGKRCRIKFEGGWRER